MKRNIDIVAVSALALLMASCDNSWNPDRLLTTEGDVEMSSLVVTVDNSITETMPSTGLDVNDYTVSITDAATNVKCGTWKYSEMPEVITLPVGDYTLDIENAPLQDAAWDSPYYHVEKSFSIQENEISSLGELTCVLSNVAVSVRYSDALKAALGSDVVVNVATAGDVSLDYVGDESRIGYFSLPGDASTLVASFSGTVNGHYTTLVKTFTGVKTGQHHYVTFSVNNGSISPDLIIDADITFDDVDIDIPGGEDPDPGDRPGEDGAPTVTSQTLDLDAVNIVTEDLIARVDISAPNGIEKLEVTIVSESLTPDELVGVGLTDHFDLAHPGEYEDALQGLGFQTGNDILGKKSLTFDISSFMPLLVFFPGNHNFQLDITDSKGLTVSATLKFYTPE